MGMAPHPGALRPAQGHRPVPRGRAGDLAAPSRPADPALRRSRQPQVRDLLPVRDGLPDRDHRHGRRRHQEPVHVHWGPPEQYAERREESALRRSGRPCRTGCSPHGCRSIWARSSDILVRERLRPAAHACDPRADPGRIRLPAGRRAAAHQPLRPAPGTARSTASARASYPSSFSTGRVTLPSWACAAARTASCGRRRHPRRAHRRAGRRRRRRVTADGAVRFVAAECGGDTGREPLVTLDGQAQPEMTPAKAAELATLRCAPGRPRQAPHEDPAATAQGMPSILLARIGQYDPDRPTRAGRAGGRLERLEKGGPTHESGGGHSPHWRCAAARAWRRGLSGRRQVACRGGRGQDRLATWSPTASRPTRARRSIACSWNRTRTRSSRASRWRLTPLARPRLHRGARAHGRGAQPAGQRRARCGGGRLSRHECARLRLRTSTSRSSPSRAAWSWVRKRRSYAQSRTSAPSPTSGRPIPRVMACGADRPS